MELGRYDGGKGNIFRHLINQMPPHDTYVAAFAGSDAVALNKRPARRNVLIDRDEQVITAWVDHLVKNDDGAASSHLAVEAFTVTSGDNGRYNFSLPAATSNSFVKPVTSTRKTAVNNARL